MTQLRHAHCLEFGQIETEVLRNERSYGFAVRQLISTAPLRMMRTPWFMMLTDKTPTTRQTFSPPYKGANMSGPKFVGC